MLTTEQIQKYRALAKSTNETASKMAKQKLQEHNIPLEEPKPESKPAPVVAETKEAPVKVVGQSDLEKYKKLAKSTNAKVREHAQKKLKELEKKSSPKKSGGSGKGVHKSQGKFLTNYVKEHKSLHGYKGKSEDELRRDAFRKGKRPGKRVSDSGKIYYEYRLNRSDIRPHAKIKLEDGGMLDVSSSFEKGGHLGFKKLSGMIEREYVKKGYSKKEAKKLGILTAAKVAREKKAYEEGGQVDSSFGEGGRTQAAAENPDYSWRNDRGIKAKPVGYRYTDLGAIRLGVSSSKKPSKEHIKKYVGKYFTANGKKQRYLYIESRKDKSDFSQKPPYLETGGQLPATAIGPASAVPNGRFDVLNPAFEEGGEVVVLDPSTYEDGGEIDMATYEHGGLLRSLYEAKAPITISHATEGYNDLAAKGLIYLNGNQAGITHKGLRSLKLFKEGGETGNLNVHGYETRYFHHAPELHQQFFDNTNERPEHKKKTLNGCAQYCDSVLQAYHKCKQAGHCDEHTFTMACVHFAIAHQMAYKSGENVTVSSLSKILYQMAKLTK